MSEHLEVERLTSPDGLPRVRESGRTGSTILLGMWCFAARGDRYDENSPGHDTSRATGCGRR